LRCLLSCNSPELSSGRTTADWVFISDVVQAYLRALTAPGVDGATIDVGSGNLVSVRAVVEQIAGIVGGAAKPKFGVLPDRPAENEFAAETALAATKLGWRASTSLQDGLQQTVAWYRAEVRSDRC
jgi:nucleoside-diphosphate-sugar epimerase